MTEHYDAVLAHVYMYNFQAERPRSSIRGHMQVSALAHLYREGRIGKIFIAGGKVWGEDYPSLAELMRDELQRKSVKTEDIIINPQAKDTPKEIDLFLQEAENRNWVNIGDVANETHQRRIVLLYSKRRKKITHISAEKVLSSIQQPNHPYRQFPYLQFLENFSQSDMEKVFKRRELFVTTLYRLGFEKLLSRFARSNRVQKFKVPFDA